MASDVKVLEILDVGNDVLRVVGIVDGVEVLAHGWVSATTNHFDEADYEDIPEPKQGQVHKGKVAGRHLKPGAQSRVMDDSEKRAYAARRLLEQA
jgi:hypothetical protein